MLEPGSQLCGWGRACSCPAALLHGWEEHGTGCIAPACSAEGRSPSRRVFILRVQIHGGKGQPEKSGISTGLAGREKVTKS